MLKKVVFYDTYNESYTYALEPESEESATDKVLSKTGLATPFEI